MPRIGLAWDQILMSHDMHLYRVFLESLEPYIDQSLHDWHRLIEQEAEKISNVTAREDFYSFHSDEYAHRLQVRPVLMNACFTAIFAQFENQLLRICSMAKEHLNSPFSAGHLSGGSPTDRAKKYLDILGVDFPSGGSDWTRITWLRELRNKIVHNGGILLDHRDKNKTVKYAVANGIVANSVVSDDVEGVPYTQESEIAQEEMPKTLHLELTRSFCDAELNHLEKFLLQVYSAYSDWSGSTRDN